MILAARIMMLGRHEYIRTEESASIERPSGQRKETYSCDEARTVILQRRKKKSVQQEQEFLALRSIIHTHQMLIKFQHEVRIFLKRLNF